MDTAVNISGKETTNGAFAIEAEKISKRYNRDWIFRDLTYTFNPGNTYAVTGPNGSGKSTLLQVLWGQVPQTSGVLRYRKHQADVAIDLVFRYVAIATPYMDLIEDFTLREMLDFHFSLRKRRPSIRREDLARKMYLENELDKPLVNFSSGMRQRLKLALAFFTDADVYFLDEPGTNLDEQAFRWYREQLAALPSVSIVVIASNNPEEYPGNAVRIPVVDLK